MLDENLHYGLDWDLFIRIGKRFHVAYIPEYLGSIREHGEAKTSIGGRVRFQELVGVIRKHGNARYPLSYLNYAWDTYGSTFARSGFSEQPSYSVKNVIWSFIRKLARRIWEWLYSRAQQGYYPDGWTGKRAMFVLPNLYPDDAPKQVELAGEAFVDNVPLKIRVRVNKEVNQTFSVSKAGPFHFSFLLPPTANKADSYHVLLQCNKVFPARDMNGSTSRRDLGFILRRLEIECCQQTVSVSSSVQAQ
jgi:hypothetical protein